METRQNFLLLSCSWLGESNHSFGINCNYVPEGSSEVLQPFHCFSCGASGSLPRLLLLSQPERFTSFANAVNFLENRYGVAYGKVYKNKRSKVRIRRYGEIVEETGKKTLPKVTLALYKSGKETYTYFFNRGFDEADMKEYMIGRDIENKTVTIPVFWEDKSLAGVIGRYIS